MDRDLHSEQPNVGSLRTYRSQSDLAYSYNRAMGIAMFVHRRPCLVGRGPTQRSGYAQLGHVIRPTKRCGNCVTVRRLLINSAQTFHHTSRWNLSIVDTARVLLMFEACGHSQILLSPLCCNTVECLANAIHNATENDTNGNWSKEQLLCMYVALHRLFC